MAKVAEALTCAALMDEQARARGKDPVEIAGKYEALLMAATAGMDEHPDGYDGACDCNLCRSYD